MPHAPDDHPVLDLRRVVAGTIPDSSVRSVQRVAKFDGRTRIVAGREPGGTWAKLHHRTHFTREHVRALRAAGVSEVILKRGFRRASFPLGWVSQR